MPRTAGHRQQAGSVVIQVFLLLHFASVLLRAQGGLPELAIEPLKNWTLRHETQSPAHDITGAIDIAFGNGVLAIVGLSGITISSDAQSWTQQIPGLTTTVAFGNGRFVACRVGPLVSSSSGTNWVAFPASDPQQVAFANGKFLALSRWKRTLYISEDGIQWRTHSAPIYGALNDIAFGNGVYVGVGGETDSTNDVAVSTDLTNWTSYSTGLEAIPLADEQLHRVIFAEGRFLAVGTFAAIFSSPDGINWTRLQSGLRGDPLYDIIYEKGMYVIVGGNSIPFYPRTSIILASTNGVDWSRVASPSKHPLTAVTFGNGRFFAVSTEGGAVIPDGKTDIVASENGTEWHLAGIKPKLESIAFGDNRFVAVGQNGTILSSSDTTSWSSGRNAAPAHLADVTYGNGTFVAVGETGTIVNSNNGIDWEQKNSGTQLNLTAVRFARALFIAVGGERRTYSDGSWAGGDYVIVTSTDGNTWTAQHVKDQGAVWDVAYGDGRFFALGSMQFKWFRDWNIYVLHSTNGIAWSRIKAPISPHSNFNAVEYGNGRFIALDTQSGIATLTNRKDATAWRFSESLGTKLYGLGFGRKMFLGLGQGVVLASIDGANWQEVKTGHPNSFHDVAFGQNSFVAVADGGRIFQSGIFDPLPIRVETPNWDEGRFTVAVQSEPGHEYILEHKRSMNEIEWQKLDSSSGDGSSLILSDPNASTLSRFYRLRVR